MIKLLKTPQYWEVAQFQIEPALQSRGLGAELLTQIVSDAKQTSLPVRLSVLKGNPALKLYERLGFKVVGEDASAFQMQTEVTTPGRT
jgi:ribosomal protein S18 acetylase RimI-like enzyme